MRAIKSHLRPLALPEKWCPKLHMALPSQRSGLLVDFSDHLLTPFKIIIAGVIYGHIASKYIYVRIFRGTKHMGKGTLLATGSWSLITLTLWIIAWIIA